MSKVRVLICDDSMIIRKIVTGALSEDHEIEICGSACNGAEAVAKVTELNPDALVIDVEMPDMDGITAVRKIREVNTRMPIIMFSTLTERGALTTLDALAAGATDYVNKPANVGSVSEARLRVREQLIPKIKVHCSTRNEFLQKSITSMRLLPGSTSRMPPPPALVPSSPLSGVRRPVPPGPVPLPSNPDSKVRRPLSAPSSSPGPFPMPDSKLPSSTASDLSGFSSTSPMRSKSSALGILKAGSSQGSSVGESPKSGIKRRCAVGEDVTQRRPGIYKPEVVVIGVSTGGPNALQELLPIIPKNFPLPVLVVQHMPPVFTQLLAERLSLRTPLPVKEAKGGELLAPGTIWLAPGDFHMVVEKAGAQVRVALNKEAQENSCRPAVDVLFRSAVKVFGGRTLGVVLTGMGSDGCKGCELIKDAQGQVIVQDQATSVVWGMPGFVANNGLADAQYPLGEIGFEIVRRATTKPQLVH